MDLSFGVQFFSALHLLEHGKELEKGVHFIGKKLVEEASESWMAAEYEGNERTAEELSQLLYHAQVMMIRKGLTLEDVYRHL